MKQLQHHTVFHNVTPNVVSQCKTINVLILFRMLQLFQNVQLSVLLVVKSSQVLQRWITVQQVCQPPQYEISDWSMTETLHYTG